MKYSDIWLTKSSRNKNNIIITIFRFHNDQLLSLLPLLPLLPLKLTLITKMHTAYLSIGSNLGNRQYNIDQAVSLLKANNITINKVSSIIETEPVGGVEQGKFLNGCLAIQTALNPQELLQTLQSIEQEMGRVKTVRNGPRIIDLDILTYDDIRIDTDVLIIPHPRMAERDFVLKPLYELDPELVKTITDARH